MDNVLTLRGTCTFSPPDLYTTIRVSTITICRQRVFQTCYTTHVTYVGRVTRNKTTDGRLPQLTHSTREGHTTCFKSKSMTQNSTNNTPTCPHDNFGRGFVLPAATCPLFSGDYKVVKTSEDCVRWFNTACVGPFVHCL